MPSTETFSAQPTSRQIELLSGPGEKGVAHPRAGVKRLTLPHPPVWGGVFLFPVFAPLTGGLPQAFLLRIRRCFV